MDLMLKLFDNTILPILTYASEIFGYENLDILERIHLKFLRYITKLRQSTPIYMIMAELGRLPINITIKCKMISYWHGMATGNQNKLSYKIYQLMLNLPNFKSKWIEHIKDILIHAGRPDIWMNPQSLSNNLIKKLVKQIYTDQYYQSWHDSLQNSSKGINYSFLKDSICLEKFFLTLNKYDYLSLVKFRSGNHYLPIEVGRWEGIELNERTCCLCTSNSIGDEMHYLLVCPFFTELRELTIDSYYYTQPNIHKYKHLMTSTHTNTLTKLSRFARTIMDVLNPR